MRQNARQPWLALGISRATWYRLGKPTTKPEQPMAQALLARAQGVSLRSFQRTARIVRKAPSLADSIATGSLKPGHAERVLFPVFRGVQPDGGSPPRLGNKPLFTEQEFKTILMCLHPDGARSPEKLHAAFSALKARERHLTRKKRR
jgi:hypothetical protein